MASRVAPCRSKIVLRTLAPEGEDEMLRGERVALRPLQEGDLDGLVQLFQDLETSHRVSNSPPIPWSKARWEREFEKWTSAESDDTNAHFAIEVEGKLIGMCQLWSIDHYRGLCNLAITLDRAYWGQGYGQDSVRTLVAYAFRYLNMRKVSLEVLADDERAVGAYKKAGFVEEGRLRQHAWFQGAYADALVMGLLRDEWNERQQP
jgi:RimJ/RimL family protein N-acetyltransferase